MTGTVTVALPSVKYPTTTPMWDRDGKATLAVLLSALLGGPWPAEPIVIVP